MSGSSSSKPQNVVQKVDSESWGPSQDLLKWSYGEGLDAAKSGQGFQPWGGARYIEPNQWETTGLGNILQIANGGVFGLDNMKSNWSRLAGDQTLQNIASGKYAIQETGLGRDNADFRGMVDRSVRQGVDEVTGLFSGGGRYGSGAHTFGPGGVQQTASDIAGDMYGRQYNIDADRLTAQRAANIANRAGAANSMVENFGALTGLAGQIDAARYKPYQMQVDVGAALRGEAQAKNQAEIDAWNAQQASYLAPMEWANNLAAGVGGGSQLTTQQVPQGSRIHGLLGGAMTGAAAGSAFGNPWGTAIGAGAGGLMGMFS